MAKKRLAGQRALVTGASSGIGMELAKLLAAEGANLVITARRQERLEALAQEIKSSHGVEVRIEALDLAAPGAAEDLFDRTEGAGHAVDVLVNNAGFGAYEEFVNIPWERYAGMLQVNVVALTRLSHLFLPGMIKRKHGHLMNVASMGAYMPVPTFAVYAATKAYVRNMTEAIDYELDGTGVHAISVCPGGTRTEFLDVSDQKLKSSGELAMMTAERCARIAVKKMLAGRRNVVTGFLNALSVFLMRFLPRPMIAWFAHIGMASAVEKDPKKALPAPKAASEPEPESPGSSAKVQA
jgi:short-subunit dehydrogenase